MKKLRRFIFLLFFVLISVFILNACGGKKLPKNEYEKVKFAFNGVEKSFKKLKVDSSYKLNNNLRYLKVNDTDTNLNAIKAIYTSGDNQGDVIDEIEYDAPPMIQFQYLKKVLEKTGQNYKFNTKYNDVVTGTIYMDMETGKEKENDDNYKANYEFDLAIKINIDSNDLITADVSFDITVTQNSKTYKTKWYVGFILDYDMSNTSNNYTLTLVNENDEKGLTYNDYYVYEYDYVEVKEGKIKEWRKFCYETDTLLVKDDTHSSFDDYVNDDIEFRADTCKWYYDGSLKKITQSNKEKEKTLGNAFFNLGLNDNDINPTPFFNESSTKNDVIKTCYAEFSKIAKKDIILSIVDGGEEHSDHQTTPAKIVAYANNTDTVFTNYQVPNIRISELFSGYDDDESGRVQVQLWYQDEGGGNINQIINLESITYTFSYADSNDCITVGFGDEIKDIYANYVFDKGLTEFDRNFKLVFIDETNNVSGYTVIYYKGELPEIDKEPFPDELKHMGLPIYDASYDMTNATFSYNSSTKTLTISNSDSSHAMDYMTDLQKSGFTLVDEESTLTVKVYKKQYGSDKELFVTFDITNDAYTLKAEIKDIEVGPDDPGEDEEDFVFSIVGSMNSWDEASGIQFTKGDGCYYYQGDFNQNDKFKIVKDNSWANGSYGYSNIIGINEYPKYFSQADGDDDNILVTALTVRVNIIITITNGSVSEITISAKGSQG